MKADRYLQGASNFVCVAIGLFAGLAIADIAAGVSLREWQTLIAGMLAVFAALLTIGKMTATDREQHSRHDELVRLTLRADRLRIRRAAWTNTDNLHRWAREGRKVVLEDVDRMQAGEPPQLRPEYRHLYRTIHEILARISYAKADELFDPKTAFTYRDLSQLVQRLEPFKDFLDGDEKGLIKPIVNAKIGSVLAIINEISVHCDDLADALSVLVGRYDDERFRG